jgi:hypothetical protein
MRPVTLPAVPDPDDVVDRTATYPNRNHIYALFKPVSAGGSNECTTEKPCRLYLRAW